MAGRRLAVHGVCLLRLRASRPLRAVLDVRLLRLRAGRPLRTVLDMRLLRLRARRVLLLLLYRARAGSARLSLPVSYTHLDVYKRQVRVVVMTLIPPMFFEA